MSQARPLFHVLACAAGALLMAWGTAAVSVVPDIPVVEGPITGPGPMHPGIRPGPAGTNLEDFD